jgi:hypothetical protein
MTASSGHLYVITGLSALGDGVIRDVRQDMYTTTGWPDAHPSMSRHMRKNY